MGHSDKIEIEYKWLLIFDPVNSQLPIPSENANPLPAHLAQKSRTTAEHPSNVNPKADEPFGDPRSKLIWSEFNTCKSIRNPHQVKIDISKPKKLWFYLGKTSTEAKAQYTGNPAVQRNDPTAHFLESVRIATTAVALPPRRSFPASYPTGVNVHAVNAARPPRPYVQPAKFQNNRSLINKPPNMQDRVYHGKYAIVESAPYDYKSKVGGHVDPQALHNQRAFQHNASKQSPLQPYNAQKYQNLTYDGSPGYRAPPAPMGSMAPTAPMMATASQRPSSLHGDIYGQTIAYHHQSKQQREPRPQPQAPVANMMGGGSSVAKNPFSRPPSAQKAAPAYGNFLEQLQKASGLSTIPLPEKYAYLHAADKLRPAVYQSPYAQGGGFTPAYQPVSIDPPQARAKSGSLSEDFLMKRSPSQQELVKSQLIIDREFMIKRQQEAFEQRKDREREMEQHNRQQQPPRGIASTNSQSPRMPLQPLNFTHQHAPPPPQQSYYPPQTYQYDSYSTYQNPLQNQYSASSSYPNHAAHSPSFTSPHPHQSPPPNYTHTASRPAGGLQFQSPQDFQMQMQREAQQQEWTKSQGSFDHFFRGLQNAAGNGGGSGTGSCYGGAGQSGGQSGSPLKAEMGGGGEMLPVMGGRF